VYLGRAPRDTLLLDNGKSMARWEPEVQNYLGFPAGIPGPELLRLARRQAERYRIRFHSDHILGARAFERHFTLRGEQGSYRCRRLLLATGIFHVPPDIPGVTPCLGHSLFFCKDCDGYRVRGKHIAVYGWTDEAASYALAMLHYTSHVVLVTDGRKPQWARRWEKRIREFRMPVFLEPVREVHRVRRELNSLEFADATACRVDALFTTRGDIYFNDLARQLGAEVNRDGEIVVDLDQRTSVPRLYAAGCVTPANCQMIIAAGQGAVAAQAMNRDLFDESLADHSLRRLRFRQLGGQ
jgi:thioredoxin reductase (NADPH)